MSCAICWDTMDMEEYQDEKESTETCFKLECHHAFHTKCIMECLLKSKSACPLCNKDKDPIQQLEIVGLARKFFSQAVRDPEISALRREFNIATTEYQDKLREHRKKCTEAVQLISDEMNIAEHRSYYMKAMDTVKRAIKTKIDEMGPKHIGAALFKKDRWDTPLVESMLLPGYRSYRWRFWRMIKPRFSCPVLRNRRRTNELVATDGDRDDSDDVHSLI